MRLETMFWLIMMVVVGYLAIRLLRKVHEERGILDDHSLDESFERHRLQSEFPGEDERAA